MPHDHEDPVEAVADAAEAIEHLAEGNKTPSVGPFSDHKLRSVAALILASASLLATIGTFAKTCDHSVTENAYTTLSANIAQLAETQKQNHDDIVAMRGYLDGLARAPMTDIVADAGVPFPMPAGPPPKPPATKTSKSTVTPLPPEVLQKWLASADAGFPDDTQAMLLMAAPAAAPVAVPMPEPPEVHPTPTPIKQKPWADVASGK
jgi:hypothetical protein